MVEIRPAIRAATEADRSTIRKMVFAEHLDPTSLNWRHFLVAEMMDRLLASDRSGHIAAAWNWAAWSCWNRTASRESLLN